MKIFAIVIATLALSSVACSPSMSEPMVPNQSTKVQKDPASVHTKDCECDNRGGGCIIEGASSIGSGVWDLTKRGANWAEQQAKDPENQKKASDAWESVKSGASSLYDKARDAVK